MSRRLVLLLRGVNVGGRNQVPMAELRAVLSGRGLEDVRTHLQSGNVIATTALTAAESAELCRAAIRDAFGLEIAVLGRDADELAAVVQADPLGGLASDPKRYLVSFLSAPLPEERVQRLRGLAGPGERLIAAGRELYSWHPDGVGRSKLWEAAAREGAGRGDAPVATARNWATVSALLSLL